MDGATIAVGMLQSIKRGYEASHNRGIVGEEGGYWDIHWILASFFGFSRMIVIGGLDCGFPLSWLFQTGWTSLTMTSFENLNG